MPQALTDPMPATITFYQATPAIAAGACDVCNAPTQRLHCREKCGNCGSERSAS
jgi:hypothetical protein